jgi:hypothetical protein
MEGSIDRPTNSQSDGACCGVDDTDRIIAVVDGGKRLSIRGKAQAGGVGSDTETDGRHGPGEPSSKTTTMVLSNLDSSWL